MSTQLKDGSFTQIEELPDAVDTLNDHIKKGDAEKFHIGEQEGLEEMIRNQESLAEQFKKIK